MSVESVDVRLARIETKLDAFLDQSKDHETRIRKLERMVWTAAGAAAVAGGALSTVVQTLLSG